ncbi:hypothetical protein BDA99DRAFT_560163 [Phascolomyces articulosus]|uniref:Uncharacterized protein n=1 Tax=Phascolomyces articulosus TaxID=60185 RepID=A0AAD5KCX8_9FUNG|nr:hypothetical protein BDA99DRAFT_560163 [Phascolomyces articulosus]
MVTFGFEFKNIIFGGNNNNDQQDGGNELFGMAESKRQRRSDLFNTFVEDCKGYICESSLITTTTNMGQEQEQDIIIQCVDKPIDCPCPHPLENKQYIGDWYACVRTRTGL